MTARPPKDVFLGLDMPFGEAMERFIAVSPKDLEANIAKDKGKKPPGTKKKAKASGAKAKSKNIISLKDRKTSLRRRGLA